MAETIQYFMEEMVPELEDLESKGIFSRAEIKQLVKQREIYEYRLKRRGAKKIDFIRYVEYECNIEALRIKRKSRLGIQGSMGAAEHAVTRRIHFILDRAVNKFKGDVDLWMQYIEYARTTESYKHLGKLFARAIQMHPNREIFWTNAAMLEYEDRHNIQAARALMQRGIRLNPEKTEFWLSYARIELQFVKDQLLKKRADTQSPTDSVKRDDDNLSPTNIDSLEEVVLLQPKDNHFELPKELRVDEIASLATTPVLQMKIPRVLFHSAVKQFPKDINLRLSFLSIYKEFPGTEEAQKDVYENLRSEFPLAVETQLALAERHFYGVSVNDSDDSINNCLVLAEKELENFSFHQKANILVLMYLHLLQINESLVMPRLEKTLKKALDCQGKLILTEDCVEKIAACNLNPKTTYNVLVKATSTYPSSISLWTLRVENYRQLEVLKMKEAPVTTVKELSKNGKPTVSASKKARKSPPMDGETVKLALDEAKRDMENSINIEYHKALQVLEKVNPESGAFTNFHLHFLQWLETASYPSSFIEQAYESSCKASNVNQDALLERYLQYLESKKSSLPSIQGVVDHYRKIPGRNLQFFQISIKIEANLGASVERLRLLYEDALTSNMSDSEIWLDYIAAEMKEKQFDRASNLYWRAMKVVSFPDDFVLEYNALFENQ